MAWTDKDFMEDDRLYFEKYPRRKVRVRFAYPSEIDPRQFEGVIAKTVSEIKLAAKAAVFIDEISNKASESEGFRPAVIVVNAAPGFRARLHVFIRSGASPEKIPQSKIKSYVAKHFPQLRDSISKPPLTSDQLIATLKAAHEATKE